MGLPRHISDQPDSLRGKTVISLCSGCVTGLPGAADAIGLYIKMGGEKWLPSKISDGCRARIHVHTMHNKRNWNALQGLEMDKRDSPIVLLFGYNTFSLGKHSFKPFTNENEKMSLKGKQNIILKNSSLKKWVQHKPGALLDAAHALSH